MADKNIYIIRHGQTDFNLKGIAQGRGVDSSLNKTGLAQAHAFFRYYKDIPFDAVYTSMLRRTHETVRLFLELGLRHIQTPSIDEIDWGIYEGIVQDESARKRYLSIIESWRAGQLKNKIDGGESAQDLSDRLDPFILDLKAAKHQNVLVCAHGRAMRVLLCRITGKPVSEMDEFPHANTSLYKVTYSNNIFRIDLFNNSDHLNETM